LVTEVLGAFPSFNKISGTPFLGEKKEILIPKKRKNKPWLHQNQGLNYQ